MVRARLFFYIQTHDKKRCGSVPAVRARVTRLRKKSGNPGVEPRDLVLVIVDVGADRKRDAIRLHLDDRIESGETIPQAQLINLTTVDVSV